MIACTGPSRMSWAVMLKRTPRYAKPNASRARERARWSDVLRLETGKPVERLEQFDPQVMQIIMVHSTGGRRGLAWCLVGVDFLGLQIGGMIWPITTLEELR